jgi:hypothetical protein
MTAVLLLRRHVLAVGIVVAAAAAIGAFVAVARPTYQRQVMQAPADHGLPYTVASYTASDARRAFAAEGIVPTPRSHSAAVTTLGNRGDILEVDAFADRETVERSGFYNYTLVGGRYVPFPSACGAGAHTAARWRGNVRVIVSCSIARDAAPDWLTRVERALARL